MPEHLGGSSHADRSTRRALACWPRLLDIHLAAQYLSVGESTVRDYVNDKILIPVKLPGSTLRDRSGRVISYSKNRRITKILIDRADLDKLIDERRNLP
jgi:hypothetical protein